MQDDPKATRRVNEPPLEPEVTFDASAQGTEQGVELILKYLAERKLLG